VQPFLGGLIVLSVAFLAGGPLKHDDDEMNQLPQPSTWRRTINGWENTRFWQPPPASFRPSLQPVVVAAFEVLASLLALLAFQRTPERDGDFFADCCTDSAGQRHYSS
jgi:hypothetical protein